MMFEGSIETEPTNLSETSIFQSNWKHALVFRIENQLWRNFLHLST